MFEKLFHRKKLKELNTAIRLLQEEVKEKTLSTNVNHGKYLEVSMCYEDLKEEFGALRSYQREVEHENEVLRYQLEGTLEGLHDQENTLREFESTLSDMTDAIVDAQEELNEKDSRITELSQELSECQLEEVR